MSYTKIPSSTIASADTLGLVMIGHGLSISNDGKLSVESSSSPHSCGTWHPKLISGPGGAAIETESLGSDFIRLGPLLFACFDVRVVALSETKKQSYVMLEGLPFLTTENGGEYCGSVHISYFNKFLPSVSSVFGAVRQGSFSCDLWCQLTEHTELVKLQRAHLNQGSRIQGYLLAGVSN